MGGVASVGSDLGERLVVERFAASAQIFASYADIATQQFESAAFPLRFGRKDVGLAIAGNASLPFADLLARRMGAIIEAGDGERGWSALGQPLSEEQD